MSNAFSNRDVQRAILAGYVQDDIGNDVRETRVLHHYERHLGPGAPHTVYRLWNEDGTEGVRLHMFGDRTECFTIEPEKGSITGFLGRISALA